jgi:NAD(P)-dependent dehydrogenase (short-subunit alcohol dehydrogenase family)
MPRPKREIVVITGASAGVGRATAREFARRGADVGLIARGQDGLFSARKEVESAGRRAIAVPADVSDPLQLDQAADTIEKELGPIDIWINNAMTSVFAPFKEISPEEFKRVTEVTYLGYVYGTMAALRRMLPRNRGTVLQVSSALAKRSIPLQSAYCGAKHAIEGFTDSLRSELLHDKSAIHLTVVQLPAVNTPQFGWVRSKLPFTPQPVPPIYQPEVIARAIYWAAHHRRRVMDVGGSTAAVTLLNKFFPGLGDRYLARTGYKSQQTSQPASLERADNLFRPVPGDPGAHGAFSDRAYRTSKQVWLDEHRTPLILMGLAAVGLIAWRKRGSSVRPL